MNYRKFRMKSGKVVLCGKNENQNEALVQEFLGKDNFLVHTIASGSPFCVVVDDGASLRDVKEMSVMCAKHSQDWRDNKSDVVVHFFRGVDVYKEKGMKVGTFGVSNSKKLKVRKNKIKKFEDGSENSRDDANR